MPFMGCMTVLYEYSDAEAGATVAKAEIAVRPSRRAMKTLRRALRMR